MSAVGKIADLSANLENNLGLLNIKVDFSHSDFSLWKFPAPKEFSAVGAALSSQRKSNAEDGPTHKCARRLGALFEQLIPSTPKLIKAYGLRSSEIIRTPGINPKGTDKDGPFEAYVGTDCTTIWAAATSGPASLGIQLLSCILARAWPADKAVSIWVELVAERQAEIVAAMNDNCIISTSTVVAARQDISRSELANWDASVRSWLRQADQIKKSDHNQFLLIIKNVATPFITSKSTYLSVIGSWTKSMLCMERLLNDEPQQVSDRAVLLALSAWHLYPDLVVYGDEATNIKFHDRLMPEHAIITLGLGVMRVDCDDGGIRWSLALSHLRYYGDPVKVSSKEDISRVSIYQLEVVMLGALFGSWGLAKAEMIDAARWVKALWNYLQTTIPPHNNSLRSRIRWMSVFANGAAYITELPDSELRDGTALLGYGARRAGTFIGDNNMPRGYQTAFFGLLNRSVLSSLSEKYDLDQGIHYLRGLAESIGLQNDEALISFSIKFQNICYYEFATATPHCQQFDRPLDESAIKMVHGRWMQVATCWEDEEALKQETFGAETHPLNLKPLFKPQTPCSCKGGQCTASCPCRVNGEVCDTGCHSSTTLACQNPIDINSRIEYLAGKGETCHLPYNLQPLLSREKQSTRLHLTDSLICEEQMPVPGILQRNNTPSEIYWTNPPKLFCKRASPSSPISNCSASDSCQCFDWSRLLFQRPKPIKFRLVFQYRDDEYASSGFELYIRDWEEATANFQHQYYSNRLEIASQGINNVREGLQLLQGQNLESSSVWKFLDRLTYNDPLIQAETQQNLLANLSFDLTHNRCWASKMMSGTTLPSVSLPSLEWHQSLKAIQSAALVYEKIPNATISLEIVTSPILGGHWVPTPSRHPADGMRRQNAFACIVLFETGYINLKPVDLEPVLAISIDNSIYVAGEVLSDPFDYVANYDIRQLVGNIGHPGVSLMIGPQSPRVRSLSDDWRLVQHDSYNFRREDNFKGTSLHLSFTQWKVPLPTTNLGSIDQEVHFLESVISLYDRGEWVADLDILGLGRTKPEIVDMGCTCEGPNPNQEAWLQKIISLDNWEEIMDLPSSPSIVRAHENWAARLAAVSLLNQKGLEGRIGILGSQKICWEKIYMRSFLREDMRFLVLVD